MYQKLKSYLRDYFSFSQTEIKGFMILIFLLFLLIVSTFIFDFLPQKNTSLSTVDVKRVEELMVKIEVKEANERNAEKRNFSENKFEKDENAVASKPIQYFSFDPNVASLTEFEKLGIPLWLAERIIKYRSKGGKFRKKEDLQRIYSFPSTLYQNLEPYIVLANTQPVQENIATSKTENLAEKVTALPVSKKEIYKPVLIDLNKADTNDLKKLKGIASKRAMRIVQEREKLGGFYSVEQVRYIWGLDSLSIDELLKYGRVNNPSIRKIKINEVTLEEFKHPYLRPYIAKAIIAYRQQHGNFSSKKDLENIKLLDAQTLEKLLPYLSF